MKHRALSLINPTIELGGKYTCKVTTEVNFDIRSKQMVVYAPARTMNLTEEKPSAHISQHQLSGGGRLPGPQAGALRHAGGQQGQPEASGGRHRVDRRPLTDSLYDAVAHATIEDSSLEGNTEFECVMSVPDTPYTGETDHHVLVWCRAGSQQSRVADLKPSQSTCGHRIQLLRELRTKLSPTRIDLKCVFKSSRIVSRRPEVWEGPAEE
ncbi:hypothetical protein FJT64_016772 [Amphibalanus amphitrite]|uniref:Uncharacterized protein n=1 Tax=Amphibalanus amphitrite TaxID=1232801 RepID=A0A6A4WYA2_AMPAM|nr:hypothetical protein FJT64_016772 [Amphibalanus amphitrite]